MLVCVRIEKSSSIHGQLDHDFTDRPNHSDQAKTDLNKTLTGGSVEDIKGVIADQSAAVLASHAENVAQKRAVIFQKNLQPAKETAELRNVRSWRKDATTHRVMTVTFCNDFYLNKDVIDRDKLDDCLYNFVDDFCKKNNCLPSYIVRHEDEATPHYHVTFTNFNTEKNTTHKFKQDDLSAIQDSAGVLFSPVGILRGVKKIDRIIEAQKLNSREDGESEQDYNYRINKLANVIHRNVNKLHRELPAEIALLHQKVEDLKINISKNESHLERVNAQISDGGENVDKLEKRAGKYEARIEKKRQALAEAMQELTGINQKIGAGISELKSIQQGIIEAEDDYKKITVQTGIGREQINIGNDRIRVLNQEIETLTKKPIPQIITEEFEVRTGFASHKKMDLIRPKKYRAMLELINAHKQKSRIEDDRLNALNDRLNRRETALKKRENNLKSEVSNMFVAKVEKNLKPFIDALRHQARQHLRHEMSAETFDRVAEEIGDQLEIEADGNVVFSMK